MQICPVAQCMNCCRESDNGKIDSQQNSHVTAGERQLASAEILVSFQKS
jgi:hypothetical protein